MTIRGIPLSDLIALPYRRFVVESRSPREIVIRSLRKAIGPRKLFHFSPEQKPFQGRIDDDGFKIERVIRGRNAFLPVIVGKFEPSAYGARVAVTMRLRRWVMGLWLFWMGAVGSIAILAARSALVKGPAALAAIPVVLAMLAAGYLLCSVLFAAEARKAAAMLEVILTQAEIRAPSS